jgi:uncharacterized protein YacL
VNHFSPDYLFNTPTAAPYYYFDALTAALAALFIASAIAYWQRAKIAARFSPDNPVLRRLIRRMAKAGMWTSAIGLFLAAMRYAAIPYLSMPILMDLLLLAIILTIGYFVYDISEHYPLAVWRLQESLVERRYRPTARPRPEPQRVRPTRVRGKQRRRT